MASSADGPSGASKAAAPAKPTSLSTDPALYIYTSLTAGSSHIVTATSRLETILRANRVPFKAIDIATNEKARMLWGRRAGKDPSGRQRKLPALVQMGLIAGDMVEIEDWNEYGELKQHVTIYYDEYTQPSIHNKPPELMKPKPKPQPAKAAAANPAAKGAAVPPAPPLPKGSESSQFKPAAAAAAKVTMPIRSIAEEAAAKAKQVHLQSLREKVYGKAGSSKPEEAAVAAEKDDVAKDGPAAVKAEKEEKKEAESKSETAALGTGGNDSATSLPTTISTTTITSSTSATVGGLQSPTTGAWKAGGTASAGEALATVQSPTTTTWKQEQPPIESLHGAPIEAASQEEIEAIEKEQAIKEEPEEEDEEDEEEEEEEEEDDDDDDDDDDDEDDEDEDDDDEEDEDEVGAKKK